MAYFHNISGVHRDGKAEIVIGLKENAFSIGYGSNASEIEFRAKDGTLLDISFPALQSLSSDILNTLKGDTSYAYPWLYAPKSALPNSLVIYGDKPNKANTAPILVEDVVCYDRSEDPNGTLSDGKVLSFNGTSNQLVPSSVAVDKIASFKDPILPGNFVMGCGNNEVCDSLVSKGDFAKKIDRGTTLAHYGIDDAYTRIQVDAADAKLKGEISALTTVVNDTVNRANDSIHYKGTVASFSALTPQMQVFGDVYTVLSSGGTDSGGCKIYAKDNVCYTHAGWICLGGGGKFDTTETFPTLPTTNKTILGSIQEVFTSASDGKKLIAESITGKGVVTEPTATYDIMATNIRNITTPTESKTVTPTAAGFNVVPAPGKQLSMVTVNGDADLTPGNVRAGVNIFGVTGSAGVVDTSSATVVPSQLLSGITAYAKGGIVTGTMPNLSNSQVAASQTSDDSQYVILTTSTSGYHASGFRIETPHRNIADVIALTPQKLLKGTTVCGIVGTATSDANATAAQILKGQTAYVNGTKVTGTIPSKAATTYTPSTGNQTIPSGQYLSGAITIQGDADLVSGNIRSGINLFGIAGSPNVVDTTAGTATAAQILSGAKAWVKGSMITGTIPSKAATTYTPSTANQTIAAGTYLSGTQTIKGDANLVSGNIKSGTTIFGVSGNANVVDTSSSTATAAQMLSGSTAFVKGAKVTGSMPNLGNIPITASDVDKIEGAVQFTTSTNGYHAMGFGIKATDSTVAGTINLTASKLLKGNTVCGIVGSATSDANATAAQILSGKTAYVNGVKVTGTIPSLAKKSYTPTNKNISLGSGKYLSGEQIIYGDSDLKAENIKEGVAIFDIPGTCRPVEFLNNYPARVYVNSPVETHGYIDVRKIALSGSLPNGAGMTPSLVQGTPVCVRGTQYYNYIVTDKGYFLTVDGVFIKSEYKFPNAESSTLSALAVEPDGSYVYASHGNIVRCYNMKNELQWEKTYNDLPIDKMIVCGATLCLCQNDRAVHFAHAKTGSLWGYYTIGIGRMFAGYGNYFVRCLPNDSDRHINVLKLDDAAETTFPSTFPSQHASEITDIATDAYGNVYIISSDGMLTRRPLTGNTTIAWSYMTRVRSNSISVDLLGNVYVLQANASLTRVLPNGTLLNTLTAGGSDCIEVSVTNQFKILIASRDRYMWTYPQSFTIQ